MRNDDFGYEGKRALVLGGSTGTDPTVGVLEGRFELKAVLPTFLPEPSAALSLPIGVMGLAGLAAMKGSG